MYIKSLQLYTISLQASSRVCTRASYAARGLVFLTGNNSKVLLLRDHLTWYFVSLMSAIQDVELFYSKMLQTKGSCLGEVTYWPQMHHLAYI